MISSDLIPINEPIINPKDVQALRYHTLQSEYLPDELRIFATSEIDRLLKEDGEELALFIRTQNQIQGEQYLAPHVDIKSEL